MGFLRKLFGGGSSATDSDRDGLYFYIKARRTGEVIRLRLNKVNDLSLMDDMQTYYVRKLAVGKQSFDRIEAEFTFDKNRRLLTADITGGDLVEKADYDAYCAEQDQD